MISTMQRIGLNIHQWLYENTDGRIGRSIGGRPMLLLRHIGADRLLWGSDMPFQDRFCTYRQSHEWLDRTGLLDDAALAAIKGGTAARLLGVAASVA